MNQKCLLELSPVTFGPPKALPSVTSHSPGGLNRVPVERLVIKLEGQVELILFPAVLSCSTQTGDESQFVLGAQDYFGDSHCSLHFQLISWGFHLLFLTLWWCLTGQLQLLAGSQTDSGQTWGTRKGKPYGDWLNLAQLLHEMAYTNPE